MYGANPNAFRPQSQLRQQMTDFDDVLAIAEEYHGDRIRIDPSWDQSPIGWLQSAAPSTRGAVGRRIVRSLLAANGFEVSGGAVNFSIGGTRMVSKTSLRWAGGEFVFQQFKFSTFDIAALVGIEPESVSLWFVPRSELVRRAEGQHGGADAIETAWLRFTASSPPQWLAQYGGTIGHALASLDLLIER